MLTMISSYTNLKKIYFFSLPNTLLILISLIQKELTHCRFLYIQLVEMASISGRQSAIEMLHCVRDSIEFIQAQTKEAKALLYQFKGTGKWKEYLTLNFHFYMMANFFFFNFL